MNYHFAVTKEDSGFSAQCVELPGCFTQADTREDLAANMSEALNLYLSEPEDSRLIFPLPNPRAKGRNLATVAADPQVAFSFALRRERLLHKMTQRQVADQLGCKNIYSYQRLENPRTANPALSTLARLKKIFPGLDLNSALGSL